MEKNFSATFFEKNLIYFIENFRQNTSGIEELKTKIYKNRLNSEYS